MRTNIEIDDKLMAEALTARPDATKRSVVEEGLRLLTKSHAQTGIRSLFGIGGIPDDYDYKAMRRSGVHDRPGVNDRPGPAMRVPKQKKVA